MIVLCIFALFAAGLASPLVVSLGSSYAFGYGLQTPIGGYIRDSLTRSTGQQWHFDNIAVSGSVLNNITKYQAPRLKGKSPSLVYIVSGGNDINYVTCLGQPSKSVCANPEPQSTWQKDFEAALDAVFANVANPTSTAVYLVTYPVALGPATKCSSSNAQCPISSSGEINSIDKLYNDQVDWTVTGLKDWQGKAANKNFHTTLIPMRLYSKGHEVGAMDAWVNGANVKNGSWHPNSSGAKQMADFVLQAYNNR